MSLLLDALRKQSAPESAPVGSDSNAHFGSSQRPTPITNSTTESNMLPVQKSLWKSRLHLGMAFFAGSIVTAATGYYIYSEISLSRQAITQNSPPQISAPASVALTAPLAASAPLPAHSLPLASTESAGMSNAASRTKSAPLNKRYSPQTVSIQHPQEPDAIDPILSSAYESYQKGDYPAAWQKYSEALVMLPNNRDALLGLAVIAQQQGKDDAALKHYRQVLLLDPRDPVAHAGLSRFSDSNPASKESRLKQLIAQQPDSAALHFALGHQYAEQSRWSDARQAYFNALAMEPGNALFAFNLAVSFDHLGQQQVAATYYRQAIQLSPPSTAGFSRDKAQLRLDELSARGD